MNIAKVFWSGRSQAVRLPKKFRFDTAEVRIQQQGNVVILEPVAKDWGWLDDLAGSVDDDLESAAAELPAKSQRS